MRLQSGFFATSALGALMVSALVTLAAAQAGVPRIGPADPGIAAPGLPGHVALSGSVTVWGDNLFGQRNLVLPNSGYRAIAAGGYHTLAIRPGGTIVAWGNDGAGQCDVPIPNAGFVAVCGGGLHSLGLKTGGTIVAWGRNTEGQCSVPAPNVGFVAIAAGAEHSLALRADGTIAAWGDNTWGQCNVPVPNAGFVAVAAGYAHSFGLRSDGSLVAWGRNDGGQCDVPSPNMGFVAAGGGYTHSVGLRSDGSIVSWGGDDAGEAILPEHNTGFVDIAVGLEHNLALRFDGSIVTWGSNDHGECELPALNGGFALVRAGYAHSVALKPSGCVPVAMSLHLSAKDLNPRSGSGFVTAALEPEPPFAPENIDVASLRLNARVTPDASWHAAIGDVDRDGRPDMLVRFDRAAVVTALLPGAETMVTVTGTLGGGCFEASDALVLKGNNAPVSDLGPGSVTPALALRGVVPNPGRDVSVHFRLANAQPARLVLFDVSGRVVGTREVGSLGPGDHVVALRGPAALVPGVYLVHLVQGEQRFIARAVVVR